MTDPGRIACFFSTSGHSGVDRAARHLIPALARRGYRVDLLKVRHHGPELPEIPVGVEVINLGSRHTYGCMPGIVRYLRRKRPRVILSDKDRVNPHGPPRSAPGPGPNPAGLPVGHDHLHRFSYPRPAGTLDPEKLHGLAYPYADRVIVTSAGVADDIAAYSRVLVIVALLAGRCRLEATPSVRLSSAVFVFYVSSTIVSSSQEAVDSLGNYPHFLADAFLLPFLVRLRPSYAYLLVAVGMASLVNGLYAIWELTEFGLEHRAAGSKGKAIPFGDVSMLLAMLSILGGIYWSSIGWRRSLLLFGAAAFGLFASIASQSRGGWLFFPVGIVVCVLYLIRRYKGYHLRIIGIVMAICMVSLLVLSQTDLIGKRLDTTLTEIALTSGKTDIAGPTALIERRDMWHAALTAFAERPLLGIGPGRMNGYFKEAHEAGLVSKLVIQRNRGFGHTHAHNDYLHAAATRGLPGLLSLTLMYGVPLWLSFGSARRSPSDDSYRAGAYFGVMLVLAYMTFSLTDSVLHMKVTSGLFVILCCWILAIFLADPQTRPSSRCGSPRDAMTPANNPASGPASRR